MELTLARPINLKPLYLFLMIILLAATVGLAASHAVQRHGNEALLVRQCIDKGNFTLNFKAPDGKYVQFCMIDKETFGLRVLEQKAKGKYSEVTAYIKTRIHSLSDLQKWIVDNNYVKVNKLP